MKIKITKTSIGSSFYRDSPPHSSAFVSNLPKFTTDVRTCKSFDEFDKRFADREGSWLSKGINHRIGCGCIIRDVPQRGLGWYIKISNLKSLTEFIENNGECILAVIDGEMTLELYDSYRE